MSYSLSLLLIAVLSFVAKNNEQGTRNVEQGGLKNNDLGTRNVEQGSLSNNEQGTWDFEQGSVNPLSTVFLQNLLLDLSSI